MSNRALAILGFAVFMIVFLYEMEVLSNRNFSSPMSCHCPDHQPVSVARLETYLFMVQSELGLANALAAEALKTAHPERAAEVRYLQFESAIAQMHSGRGLLKFRPLRESFKADYEALKTRYVAEHPDTPVPE
jgi:hypothetical protein